MAETFATPDEDAFEGRASDLQSSWAESWAAGAQRSLFPGVTELSRLGDFQNAEHGDFRFAAQIGRLQQRISAGASPDEAAQATARESQARQLAPDVAPPDIPITDAQARLKAEGITDVKLPDQPTIRKPVLDLMIQDAHDRRRYAAAVARGPQNIGMSALDFVTSIGLGIIDPVNDAAFAVPVLGEARGARLLASAGESVLARSAVRFGTGALQGAAGTAALEPADWWLHTLDGQDYTYADTLRSIAMGSLMGGTFHAGIGAYGDVRARWRGLPLPGSPAEAVERALMTSASPAAIEAGLPLDEAFPSDIFEGGERRGPSTFETTIDINGERRTVSGSYDPAEVAAAAAVPTPDEIFDDLPPPVRADLMRAAAADIIHDRPGRAGELLAIGASQDPRIAESLDADTHAARRAADGERAVYDDARLQLELAGMSAEEADANAAIVASRYAARAARLGVPDAYSLYQGEGLSIRGPGELGDEAEQTMRAYAQQQRDLFAEREGMGQLGLPGTERIGQGELAQRRADQPLKPKTEQKPMDVGLFGDQAAQKTLFQAPRPPAPPFYSAVGRAIDAARQERASPEQWLATIRNTAGVKAEELEWLGLAEWLKEQKGPVTRQAVADYVRANSIEVREVARGKTRYEQAVEARARALGEAENGPGSWQRIGGGGQEHYYRDARRELADQFSREEKAPSLETRHGQFVLAGGENYGELVLTMPGQIEPYKPDSVHFTDEGGGTAIAWVRHNDRVIDGKRTLLIEEVQSKRHQEGRKRGYRSEAVEHEATAAINDLDAVLAEAQRSLGIHGGPGRFGVRVLAEALREEGTPVAAALAERLEAAQRRYSDAIVARGQQSGAVPDAPFRTSWPELTLKRMIRYAAEHGYEQIAWTPGEVQAERYDLSKHITDLRVVRSFGGDGKHYTVDATRKGHSERTRVADSVPEDKLADHVGKEMAEKIVKDIDAAQSDRWGVKNRVSGNWSRRFASKDEALAYQRSLPESTRGQTDVLEMTPKYGTEYSGLDLKVGGEGMHAFYDRMLPAAANKLVKKYGAKVGEARLHGVGAPTHRYEGPEPTRAQLAQVAEAIEARPTDQRFVSPVTGTRQMFQINRVSNQHAFREVRQAMMNDGLSFTEAMARHGDGHLAEIFGGDMVPAREERSEPVHALPITPALREAAVGEGFPLFQAGEAGPRGRIMLAENRAIVDLFKGADASTFMHEMGHKWLEELARDAAADNVPQAIKDDLGTVLRWLGVDRAEDIDRARHEQFARGIERYLAEGVAPSAKLAGAFEKFKQWLLAIYRALARAGEDITPEVRGVFDRMLATDEEIAARRGEGQEAAEQAEPAAAAAASAAQPVARKRFGPAARDPATWSLFEFLAHRGGLKPNGELATIFGGKNPQVFGFGRLLRPRGMTLDRALEAAVEAGYFVEPGHTHGGVNEIGIEHLLEALDHQARGNRVYRVGEEREAAVDRGENLHHIDSEIDAVFTENGLDPKSLPDSTRSRMVEIMDREGVRDPLEAYERAIMEEDRRGSDQGQHPPAREFIPGWDVPEDAGAAPGAGERGAGGEPAAGAAVRPARRDAGKAAVDPAAWRPLAEPKPDPEADAIAAASRAAAAEPEPASVDPLKAPSAAEAAAAAAEQALKDLDPFLTAEERTRIRDALAALDADRDAQQTMIQEGAACLMAAAGAAV